MHFLPAPGPHGVATPRLFALYADALHAPDQH
jgi:hypothetical protein